MGERKGQNKYYPPDFDPKKHKSLDNYHGTHALRERARKLDQGILIIRFEMPYNIWCNGCNNHIGMGVRYNAQKSKIGKYYSTPIFKFRMKCHLCNNHFEIKTDPSKHDYVIIDGARREEQRWDPFENEQIVPEDKDTHKKLETDAMFKLEHVFDDKSKKKQAAPGFSEIAERRQEWKDDYYLNKIARGVFRKEKQKIQDTKNSDGKLLNKFSLEMNLVPESEDDKKLATLIKYEVTESNGVINEKKQKEVKEQSIFHKLHEKSSKRIPTFKVSNKKFNTTKPLKITSPVVKKKVSNLIEKDSNKIIEMSNCGTCNLTLCDYDCSSSD